MGIPTVRLAIDLSISAQLWRQFLQIFADFGIWIALITVIQYVRGKFLRLPGDFSLRTGRESEYTV